ncbi:phage tail sheath family protein [Candidatus Avoscillospira sp. LCP25S3_F1]|uniref:phage tail sheath family protein n=1 Tax=Candidatus Avoscillospira sp. LCP25S3_F1 TaxID=3438825 RepID=UPI003F8F0CA8
MAEYLSPGVYVEEFDSGPAPMQGVGTSTAGFVGLAEKGPVSGSPVFVSSASDFTRKFGGYLQKSEFGEYRYLAYAVNHFFANGGARAYVMRVVPSDAAVAAVKCGDLLQFTAKNPGSWGNRIVVSVTAASKAKSQILEDGGEGRYVLKNAADFYVGDVVELNGPDGREYGIVSAVEGNNVTMEKPFSAAVVVDTALLPKTTVRTCELNLELHCEDTVESYESVSFNITTPHFIEKVLAKSELVDVTARHNEEPVAPIDLVKTASGCDKDTVKLQLTGGSNGTAAALSDGDFIGEDRGPGSRTGIQAFLDNSDVSLMAVPGITAPNVQLSLVAHCEGLGSRFAVLDMPKDAKSVTEIMEHRNIVDSDYCAMYHPWLEVFDPLDKRNMLIPPSGSVLGIYARSDNTRGVHKAPANETVANCTGLAVTYNTAEQDMLNPNGVNLIRRFPGQGIRVWGARTASSKPQWKYVNVRRLFIFLEESIKANTNWVVFEPNDELLWIRVRRTIEVFLEGMWRSGALAGATTADAFFVNIGSNTMTQDDIDNGRLVCVIGVAPVKPAEFVIFRLTQKTGE